MKSPISNLLPVAAAVFLMCGCVSQQMTERVDSAVASRTQQAAYLLQKAKSNLTSAEKERAQEVNMPYIAGKSVPLARDVSLPRALQKGVKTAVLFPDNHVSLAGAAERIMLATGLIVSIAPDVYIEDSMLLPKSMAGAGRQNTQPQMLPVGVAQPMTPSGTAPALPPLSAGALSTATISSINKREPDSPYGFDFPRTEAPLSQILDLISVRLGIRWKFDETTSTIKFYRLVTKSWQTPFSSASSSYTTNFEGSTAASTNANAAALKPGQSPINSSAKDINELKSITESVGAVMTKSGSIIANSATGTITMTDTVNAVEEADSIITKEIASLSRQVMLKVQTIQVTSNDAEEVGVDIAAVVNAALQNMPNLAFTTGSPASVTSTNAGSFGLSVLSGNGNGTTAIVKALKQYGKVQTSTELPLITRNRHAIYYNVTNTFSYVASTTPGTASVAGGTSVPGITTAQDQVGLKLMLYPNVTSKDTVNLTMAIDQSVLDSLVTFTSGSGSNLQSVQLPNKNGEGSSQEVPIRNGQTVVITGFDKKTDQYDKRSLANGVPVVAGGSAKAGSLRTTTVVLVSVLVKDIDN